MLIIKNKVMEPKKRTTWVITLGLSKKSKGVMFVLYSISLKGLLIYQGILSADLEDAISTVKNRGIKEFEIWNSETFAEREKRGYKDTHITFGKYKGLTVEELFDKDKNYLYWLAKNANFKSEKMQAVMEGYREIIENDITKANAEKSNTALKIETGLSEKNLKVYAKDYNKILDLYTIKLIDSNNNKYYYKGTSEKVVKYNIGETLTLNCKIAGNFVGFGVTFNVLKLR